MATTVTTNWPDIQANSINMHAEVHSRVHNKLLNAFGAGSNWVVKGFDLTLYADTVSGVNSLCASISPGVAVHDITVIDFETGMASTTPKTSAILLKVFDTSTPQPANKTWYAGVRYGHGLVGSGLSATPSVATMEVVPSGGNMVNFSVYYTLILDADYIPSTHGIDPTKIKVIDHRYDHIALYEHIKYLSNRHITDNINYGHGSGGFLFYRETDGYTDRGYRVDPHTLRLNTDQSFIIEDGTKNLFPNTNLKKGIENWIAVTTDSSVANGSGGYTSPITTTDNLDIVDTVYGKALRVSGSTPVKAFDLVSTTKFPVKAGDWLCVSFKWRSVGATAATFNVGWYGTSRGTSVGYTSANFWLNSTDAYERSNIALGDNWKQSCYHLPIYKSSTYNFDAASDAAVLVGLCSLTSGMKIDVAQFQVEKLETSWMDPDEWVFHNDGDQHHLIWDASHNALLAVGPTLIVHESMIPLPTVADISTLHIRCDARGATTGTNESFYTTFTRVGFRALDASYNVIDAGTVLMPDLVPIVTAATTSSYATFEGSLDLSTVRGTGGVWASAKYLQLMMAMNYTADAPGVVTDKMWIRNIEVWSMAPTGGETYIPGTQTHSRFSTYTPKKRAKDRFYVPVNLLTPTMGQIDIRFNHLDSVAYSPKTGFLWQIATTNGYYGLRYKRNYPPTTRAVQFIMKSESSEIIIEAALPATGTSVNVSAVWSKLGEAALYVNGAKIASSVATFVFDDAFTSDLTMGSNVAHTSYADARFYNIRVKAVPDTTYSSTNLYVIDPTTIALIPTEQGIFMPSIIVDSVIDEDDDDDPTILDDDIIKQIDVLKASLNRECLVTQGVAEVTATGYLKWSTMELIASGRNQDLTTSGKFTISMPANGTVARGVGGAANKTFTTNGILLASGEALYYDLPLGTDGSSKPGNFYVTPVTPTKDYTLPAQWVLIAAAYAPS